MSLIATFAGIASGGSTTLYKWLAIGGVILSLCVGSYFYGVHVGNLKANLVLAQFQAQKVKEEADLLSLNTITNTKIVTQYVTRTVQIHDQANTIQQAIPQLPDREYLSVPWVLLYNASLTTGAVPSPTSTADATSQGVEARAALGTITENNSSCLANQEQLSALQAFVTEQQKNIERVNKTR